MSNDPLLIKEVLQKKNNKQRARSEVRETLINADTLHTGYTNTIVEKHLVNGGCEWESNKHRCYQYCSLSNTCVIFIFIQLDQTKKAAIMIGHGPDPVTLNYSK